MLFDAAFLLPNHFQRESHVGVHIKLGQQAEILEDIANGLAQLVNFCAFELINVEVIEVNIAGRKNVDLPEPDGPMRKTNSPSSILKDTSFKAGLVEVE